MKKTILTDLRLLVAAIVSISAVAAVIFYAAPAKMAARPEKPASSVAANEPEMPSLSGADAVNRLRADGRYDSLVDAVKAVTERDGRTLTEAFGEAAVLTVNDSQPGRVAVVVDSNGIVVPPYERRVVVFFVFDANQDAIEPTITISGSLAARSVSDVFGNELRVRWP